MRRDAIFSQHIMSKIADIFPEMWQNPNIVVLVYKRIVRTWNKIIVHSLSFQYLVKFEESEHSIDSLYWNLEVNGQLNPNQWSFLIQPLTILCPLSISYSKNLIATSLVMFALFILILPRLLTGSGMGVWYTNCVELTSELNCFADAKLSY